MRKILVTMASMVLVLVMCFSSLVGCGLVTTDTERDMNQEVAIIQISDDAEKDVIYKKDMVMAYLNYGYMYEQYYGYTREQTFTLIIDSLINNRIFVQSAIAAQFDSAKGWDVAKYLDDEQNTEATYSTYKSINDLLESYKTQPESEKADTSWESVRTTPTNAANKEKELSLQDKKDYIAEGFKAYTDDGVAAEERTAFNKVIELLRVNELLGDEYKGKIEDTVYFKQTLKNYQESELITAVETQKKYDVMKGFTFAKLNEEYQAKRNSQSEMSDADLIAKLSSATVADPMLVGLNDKYGYVYNLLIGADDVLTSKISNIKTDLDKDNITKDEYVLARKNILASTLIYDQRSSWITSGYDFDGTKFTGDYTFAENVANSLDFKGSVTKIKDATDDESAKYRVDSLTEYNLDSFIAMMESYVYDGTTDKTVVYDQTTLHANQSVYRKVTCSTGVTEYESKINELMFAFSTDPGSLNTYKGYVIKPKPEGSNSEEYMQEFADAARELIATTNNQFGYIMVATDYGYHIMFYSEILKADYGYATLTEYLDSLYGTKTWEDEYNNMISTWEDYEDTESYLYLLANSLFSTEVSNAVTKYQRDTLNTYRYDEESDAVTLYKDRYADLLK